MTEVLTLEESRMSRLLKDERGLTMVELLATVVILAIILGIGALAIGQVIQNSKEDAQVAEVQNAYQSAEMYFTSTNNRAGTSFNLEEVNDANYLQSTAWVGDMKKVLFTVDTNGALLMNISEAGMLKAGTSASSIAFDAAKTKAQILDLSRKQLFKTWTP